MSQPEPVIWQVSSPVPRAPATDRALREAFRNATAEEKEERVRGARERLHTLGTFTAVFCGLMLNYANVAHGVEIGVAAIRELGILL